MGATGLRAWLTTRGALRVPAITAAFWVIKGLSTAMGEATSDFLVHVMAPVLAVLIGFAAFLLSLIAQLRQRRYVPWAYWLAVVMVGTFGTMAADVVHVGLGVPYAVSSVFYACVLATVFVVWARTEHTLSIHTVDTARRELFYWAAVVATFAMGTAVGDFAATTLHLGYLASAAVFALLITVPALGYRFGHWNAIGCFWTAYVLTRPLGASVADWLGKPRSLSGLGLGSGWVALACGVLIAVLVGWLTVSGHDVQSQPGTEHESVQPA